MRIFDGFPTRIMADSVRIMADSVPFGVQMGCFLPTDWTRQFFLLFKIGRGQPAVSLSSFNIYVGALGHHGWTRTDGPSQGRTNPAGRSRGAFAGSSPGSARSAAGGPDGPGRGHGWGTRAESAPGYRAPTGAGS